MQTFLPYASFSESARVLDNKRLGKQRVETLQIYKALTLPSYGWKNHPAVKMWRGYKSALTIYGITICAEWVRRGFNDTLLPVFEQFNSAETNEMLVPEWLGDEAVHASHRSNLLRKDPQFYGKYAWSEPDHLPYVWPLPKEVTP